MRRKLALILGILGVTLSALALSGSKAPADLSDCPLQGTPLCPEYPSCCK